MSRRHKKLDVQLPYICNGGRKFVRIYDSLYHSRAFQTMTPSARHVYIDMLLAAAGRESFQYPQSAYKKIVSPDTFHKAKQQLIEHGFITEERYAASRNTYYLSDKWKNF